ncbi:MAG: glycosyltransferase family 4 protein [Chitinophagaceae bacterium]
MKIHVVSETPFVMQGQGVHTAFVDHVKLLRETGDVEVVVNGEGKGDVFHSHTYGPYYFWKGRGYPGKRVFTVHVIPDSIKGSLPFWKYWYPLINWYFKKVYSYADACIAISPMVEQAIRKLNAKTHIVRIANPVLLDQWKPTEERRQRGRELLGAAPGDFLILGVGQLEGRKGVEDFLDIAEAIPEARFAWVGGRPFGVMTEGISRLNSRISKTTARIKFPGLLALKDMPEIYAAGDLFLFPSYQENCPLSPLEAAASGLPVIFRDIAEYQLLYENPYLKAKDTPTFIALTRRMMEDPDFYDHGVKISRDLLQQFDKNQIRKKLIALYRELADKA